MEIVTKTQVWSHIQDKSLFLFVTATETESKALHKRMLPIRGNDISKCPVGMYTYYIGMLGLYPIIHIQCDDMGAVGKRAAIVTVTDAIQQWQPDGIVMVGIAFGRDQKKQKLGDVLIAKSVRNYELEKKAKGWDEQRSTVPESGNILYNRFAHCEWVYTIDQNLVKTHTGELLSGEKLVDNKMFRDELFSKFPNAIGGDMEAFGVYSAAANQGIQEWIVIKGICDWAYGKSKDKKRRQENAADASVDLCHTVFSQPNFADIPSNHNRVEVINKDTKGGIPSYETVKYAMNTLISALGYLGRELQLEQKLLECMRDRCADVPVEARIIENELVMLSINTINHGKVLSLINTPGNKIPCNILGELFEEPVRHKDIVIKLAKFAPLLFAENSKYSLQNRNCIIELLQEYFLRYVELLYAALSLILLSLDEKEKKTLLDGLLYVPILREVLDPRYSSGTISEMESGLLMKRQLLREASDKLASFGILYSS